MVKQPARRVVEFFFSPGSRYSYLAASQMTTLATETGCTVDWRPVHGPDLRRLRGADPFVGDPVSGQYDWNYRRRDAEAWAEYYGIPFREPPAHDFDFKVLVRAATAASKVSGSCRGRASSESPTQIESKPRFSALSASASSGAAAGRPSMTRSRVGSRYPMRGAIAVLRVCVLPEY